MEDVPVPGRRRAARAFLGLGGLGAGTPVAAQVAMGAMLVFLAVRAVHVSQAVVSVSAAPDAYHPPMLAAGVALGVLLESTVLAVVDVRKGAHGHLAARVDGVAALVGLLALATATPADQRTTTLFWMLPYAVGAAVGLGLTALDASALLLLTGLAGAYLAVNASALAAGGGAMATAVVNALSIPSFYGIALLLAVGARRLATELDRARASALAAERELAVRSASHRYQRLIHDSVVQVLETMAAGRAGDAERMRRVARQEARRLRRSVLTDEPDPSRLDHAVHRLVAELEAALDLCVVVTAEADLPDPGPERTQALLGAAREALTNVARHAGVDAATVRLRRRDGGVELVVRDEGEGFDQGLTPKGFGTTQSIEARMADVGGRASIVSELGAGTTVRLWSPVP